MWPFAWLPYRYHRIAEPYPLLLRVRRSPTSLLLLVFIAVYLIAGLFIRQCSRRDPTSVFFDPEVGYKAHYSDVRRQEADSFVQAAVARNSTHTPVKFDATQRQNAICLGVATIARNEVRYFRSAIGSIVEGLTTKERQRLFLILFIAHTDPTVHPAFMEAWPDIVADQVLLYNVSEKELDHIRHLERESLFQEKGLFDYTYLLKACSHIGTPYVAVLEDDIIAMDGWFHRTTSGISAAERQMSMKYNGADFLYLRLFYTEEFLGWNGESWMTYLTLSFCPFILLTASLIAARSHARALHAYLTNSTIGILCGVCLPLCIALFFAAGKATVLPLPYGVNEMNNYGCCSQGLVFSHSRAQEMIAWYEEKRVGFVDMLTEEIGDRRGYVRWALTPSVLQHVGRKTSKSENLGDSAKHGRTVAERIWNFAFELNDAGALKREHDAVQEIDSREMPS